MRSPFLSVFSQISSIVFLVLKLFRFIWRVFYWNNTRTRAEQNQQQIQSISIPGRRNWQQEEIDADMDFWYTPAFAPFCVGFFFLFLAVMLILLPARLFASTSSVVFFMHLHKAKCISMLCSTLCQHFHYCFFWRCFYCTFPFLAITAHSCILMSARRWAPVRTCADFFQSLSAARFHSLCVWLVVCLFVCLFCQRFVCGLKSRCDAPTLVVLRHYNAAGTWAQLNWRLALVLSLN